MSPQRATLALALALALSAAGCGKDCPSPSFSNPTTVVGPTKTATGQTIVVRWGPAAEDKVPIEYYRQIHLGGNGSPTPVRRATLTAEREITLELEGLDAYLKSSKALDVVLLMPDTRGYVQCNHAGMADTYSVTLKLSFDAAGRVTLAEFAPVHRHYGAF